MSDSDRETPGSFAQGQSTLPELADRVAGSFAEGQEASHAEHLRLGSFADTSCPGCQEVEKTHAEHVRKGSFADTFCPRCQAMEAGAAG